MFELEFSEDEMCETRVRFSSIGTQDCRTAKLAIVAGT